MNNRQIDNILKPAFKRLEQGDYEYAENACLKVLEEQEDHPKASYLLARIAMIAEEPEEALELFKTAHVGDRANSAYALDYAQALLRQRQAEEALRIARSQLTGKHGGVAAAFVAHVLLTQGKKDDALKVCEDALVNNASYYPLWERKGDVLSRMGKLDDALAAYEAALERAGNNAQVLVRISQIHSRKRTPCAFLERVTPLLKRINSSELYKAAADLSMFAGRVYDAAEYYRKAMSLIKTPSPSMHSSLLWALVSSDKVSAEELHSHALAWDRLYGRGSPSLHARARELTADDLSSGAARLKVGIISQTLRFHTTFRILKPLLPELANLCDLYIYHDGGDFCITPIAIELNVANP